MNPVPDPSTSLDDGQRAAVEAQLDRILSSQPFQSSRRCQEFLRHVVSLAVMGRVEQLRERTIGIELFGRDPSYDKNEDSVVRVRANEVRRRLRQYYSECAGAHEPHIELHAGSYIPEFSFPDVPAKDEAVPQPAARRFAWRRPVFWTASAIILAAALLFVIRPWAGDASAEFWRPFWNSGEPVLIAVSEPLLLRPPSRWGELRGERGDAPGVNTEFFSRNIRPTDTVSASDIQPVKGLYTGVGIAAAAVSVKGVLARHNVLTDLRAESQVQMLDLRTHPAVLIGGYANLWVLRLTQNLRFHLDRKSGRRLVRDRWDPKSAFVVESGADSEPMVDYPVLSRLLNSETARPVLAIAAMTQWGCSAAAELAAQPGLLDRAFDSHPGWRNRNVQILMRVRIVRSAPARPEILRVHVW